MDKLGWGVLGAARIARRKVIPAIIGSTSGRLVAIASRDATRAKEGLAEALQEAATRGFLPDEQPRAYGSYDDLLADPAVQAVYIPLPNNLHLPWAIRSLEAGKHVLIEKPGLMSGVEAEQLQEAITRYPGLLVAEGFMFRYHPQWELAKNWIREGRIGQLRGVNIQFSFFSDDPQNIRNRKETGGGALLDLGGYAIAASRLIYSSEPVFISASQQLDVSGVDRQTRSEMYFETEEDELQIGYPEVAGSVGRSGILSGPDSGEYRYSNFSADISAAYFQRVDISGTHGRIYFERPFSPVYYEGVRPVLFGQQGQLVLEPEPIFADHFILQTDAFSSAVIHGKPLRYGIEDLAAQAWLFDAVRMASGSPGWVRNPPDSAQ